MNCKDFEENLQLFLYDEVAPEQRASWEAHLAACAGCRARLEEARRLSQVLSERSSPQPTPELLVECREALEDALDREQLGWRHLLRSWLRVPAALPASRALAALTVALVGFGLGWMLRPHASRILPAANGGAPASFIGADLANLRIRSINQITPGPQTGEVRITMDAERRVTLEGSLDDPRIRQLLVSAVKDYDNAGIRRDTLEVLRAGRNRPSVREALLYAMQKDPNPGVRLEALETVQGMECGNDVHRALVEVMERETNPGVRVAAVDALIQHAVDEKDKTLLPALERLAASDASSYVRLKCGNAVRRLVQNEY